MKSKEMLQIQKCHPWVMKSLQCSLPGSQLLMSPSSDTAQALQPLTHQCGVSLPSHLLYESTGTETFPAEPAFQGVCLCTSRKDLSLIPGILFQVSFL